MKIIICSKIFYPNNSIGAIRPSNFAKYLAGMGNEITVIAAASNTLDMEGLEGIKIIRVHNSKEFVKFIKISGVYIETKNAPKGESLLNRNNDSNQDFNDPSTFKKIIGFLKASRRQIYMMIRDIDWYLMARRIVRKKFSSGSFDVVISSYGPYSSYLLGNYIKKSGIAKRWISDFRDLMQNSMLPSWLNRIYKSSEKKMLNNADAITFVSRGQAEVFIDSLNGKAFDRNKITIIYNGYEQSVWNGREEKKDKVLKLTYTGQLYSNRRDFRLLFDVLNDLIEENSISADHVKVYYAGRSSAEFQSQLHKFEHIYSICEDLGIIDRSQALKLQRNSDILIVLSWNMKNEQGILTGKFFEYFLTRKPIIALTSGDLPGSELSKLVKELGLGIACEYCTYETDYIRLKKYIKIQYDRIQENKPLHFNPALSEMEKFHYKNLSKELNNLCHKLL